MTPCCYKIILDKVLATAAAAVIAIVVATSAVKDNYDNDNPENPFATIVVISKAHKSSSFQF